MGGKNKNMAILEIIIEDKVTVIITARISK